MLPRGTRFPIKGPCWVDLERTREAKAGDKVAVAENAIFWRGEWVDAVQDGPKLRPTLEVYADGSLELFWPKPDLGYNSIAYVVTSKAMELVPAVAGKE